MTGEFPIAQRDQLAKTKFIWWNRTRDSGGRSVVSPSAKPRGDGRVRVGRRGFSLIELVVSLAILSVCFFLILPMMHYSMQYAKQVEASNLAATIAQAKLQEIRAWAAQASGTGFRFDDFSLFPGSAKPDPDHPEFTVEVRTAAMALVSPNSHFESLYPATERRTMTRSTRKVQVDVRWRSFGTPAQLTLVSLISSPTRRFREVEPVKVFGSPPNMLAKDGTIDFTVKGYDTQDQEIPDLFFSWGVYPITGTGAIESASRDGRSATFKNISRRARGTVFYTGGACKTEARATYRGEERWGLSQVINLKN